MRGFETILFGMVPRDYLSDLNDNKSFGTILFDMGPKDKNQQIGELESFGTILFVTTLNAFSVFIFIKIWHTIIMNKVD